MTKSYTASFQQRQYCWLQNLDCHSSAYTIPLVFTIEGNLNIPVFKQTFSNLINQNDIFRTTFSIDHNNYIAVSQDADEVDFKIVDMVNDDSQILMDFIVTFISEPFILKNGPLYRSVLIKKEEESYIWCFALQHSICDLRTKELVCLFISDNYKSLIRNTHYSVNEQMITNNYGEYAQMQNHWVATDAAIEMKAFWKKTLSEIPTTISLPIDFQRPAYLKLQGTVECFGFDERATESIKAFSRQHEVTPFLCLFTAYAAMLSRYSKQEQFMIGVPFTNRRNSNFQNTMGCLINTVPIPVDFRENVSMADCMKTIRRTMLLAHRNQELPSEMIIKEVQKNPPCIDRNPLYQVGFTFEPLSNLTIEDCFLQHRYVHHGGSQLDLFALFWEEENVFQGVFEYNNALFNSETILKWSKDFCNLVQFFIENPSHPVRLIT